MPVVTIQITREGSSSDRESASPDEKNKLIAGVSQLLLEVLHRPLDSTFVIIEEVETENWGWGGVPALVFRSQRALRDSAISGKSSAKNP
jgi:4-oxalocrotonate tautomerase